MLRSIIQIGIYADLIWVQILGWILDSLKQIWKLKLWNIYCQAWVSDVVAKFIQCYLFHFNSTWIYNFGLNVAIHNSCHTDSSDWNKCKTDHPIRTIHYRLEPIREPDWCQLSYGYWNTYWVFLIWHFFPNLMTSKCSLNFDSSLFCFRSVQINIDFFFLKIPW